MERNGTHSMTKSYFIQIEAFILVYDKGNLDTLQQLKVWFDRANELSMTDSVVFSLWGNRTENKTNVICEADIQDYAPAFDVPSELIFEVDAESGWNVDESYQRVLEAVHRVNSQSPAVGFCDTITGLGQSTGRKKTFCRFC